MPCFCDTGAADGLWIESKTDASVIPEEDSRIPNDITPLADELPRLRVDVHFDSPEKPCLASRAAAHAGPQNCTENKCEDTGDPRYAEGIHECRRPRTIAHVQCPSKPADCDDPEQDQYGSSRFGMSRMVNGIHVAGLRGITQ